MYKILFLKSINQRGRKEQKDPEFHPIISVHSMKSQCLCLKKKEYIEHNIVLKCFPLQKIN